VALERTFRELPDCLRRLRDGVLALQLTAREDVPKQGSVLLIEKLADTVDDALGWIEESLALSVVAVQAVMHPVDLEQAQRSLVQCQQLFHRVQNCFVRKLLSYEQLKDLMAFGRQRQGEWRAWVRSVRKGLEQCRTPLEESSETLMHCWQEIAERASAATVSVYTTNIGQKIGADVKSIAGDGSS
jgi:hypothetical protein